jgi:hypothetical protein
MNNIGIGEKLKIDLSSILSDFERLIGPSNEWNKKLNLSNWAEYTNQGNELLKSSSFHNKYRDILLSAGKHMELEDFYYQAYPTFRIQLPDTKSVSFHRDDLSSGHAKNILNFWIPMTELNQNNCIWIVDEKDSSKLIDKFKSEKLSLNSFDGIARKKAKPVLMRKNEMLCFSNKTLHGTVQNKSNQVRVSIDFRCLPINEDPGKKILDVDYRRFSQTIKNPLTKCTSVIFQAGKVSHIGHNAQRSVINDFAARNNFSIVRETSEWHQLDFYPVILDILENSSDMPILIFSKTSFDMKSEEWKYLTTKFKQHRSKIYFCLENELFNL